MIKFAMQYLEQMNTLLNLDYLPPVNLCQI